MPALVLDASADFVAAGILGTDGKWLDWARGDTAALEGLFTTVGAVLGRAGTELGELAALVHCSGPGSVLGIRLGAMAVETWRRLPDDPLPVFRYDSLRLTASLLASDGVRDALVFSEWKKDAWKALPLKDGQPGDVTVLDDAALAAHPLPLHHLPRRKGWHEPPASARKLTYAPDRLADVAGRPGLLDACGDAILPAAEAPEFRKWTPQRHR